MLSCGASRVHAYIHSSMQHILLHCCHSLCLRSARRASLDRLRIRYALFSAAHGTSQQSTAIYMRSP